MTEPDSLAVLRETQIDHGHVLLEQGNRMTKLESLVGLLDRDVREGFAKQSLRSIKIEDQLGKLDQRLERIEGRLGGSSAC